MSCCFENEIRLDQALFFCERSDLLNEKKIATNAIHSKIYDVSFYLIIIQGRLIQDVFINLFIHAYAQPLKVYLLNACCG